MNNKRVVCFGEILWDNLKEGRRLGGAPLNVCYHLMKMGIASTIITQVGNDTNGKDIFKELEQLGVDSSFCLIADDKPTSTVEVHTTGDQQVVYDIVENVAWDAIVLTPNMEALVMASDALVFGSLINRSNISRKTLFKLIAQSNFRVFDINLRTPFYNKELIVSLLQQTNLLKLNEDELRKIMEWQGETCSDLMDQLNAIQLNYPNIEEIILTLGAEGSMYYSKEQQLAVKANKVQVRDTVGSGDSFLAAFLANKLQGESIEYALSQANLLSGFIASQHGACPVYDINELRSFQASISDNLELSKQDVYEKGK